MKKFKCLICKKIVKAPPSAKRKYCGLMCLNVARSRRRSPWLEGSNNPNWVGGLPSCLDCGKKLSNYHYKRCKRCNNLGERSPAWRGGVTPLLHRERMSMKYKRWRKAVFERDNYTCVWCGARNQQGVGKTIALNADHIKRFADYPELRYELNNGRTLCVPCHRRTGTFGRMRHAI